MNLLSCIGCFINIIEFPHLSRKRQLKIIEKKQKEIINYAKSHSDYYKKIIPDGYEKLEDIPPTTKKMFVDNFDDILTDKTLTFEKVWEHYKKNSNNAVINDKYSIVMTSGTTGAPVVLLRNRDEFIKDSIRDVVYSCCLHKGIGIFSDEDYSIEKEKYGEAINSSVIFGKFVSAILNCQDSYEELAKQISILKPGFIATYTSTIKMIANKMVELGLTVPVEYILCSGENITNLDRLEIHKGFPNAQIRSVYACTEASTIAVECKYGHLHINEDSVKIEPVDLSFNVLPYGVLSDQTLVTVYGNTIQPVIRYVLGDKIVLHKSGCPCGNNSECLEVQGRSGDILYFESSNGEKIGVAPINLMISMDELYSQGFENFRDYQIILHHDNIIELRLDFIEPCNHEEIFNKVKIRITEYLNSLGVEIRDIYLSDVPPEIQAYGIKKRRIYRADD